MSYIKNTWIKGQKITADKLNNMENGIEVNDTNIHSHVENTNNPHHVTKAQLGVLDPTCSSQYINTNGTVGGLFYKGNGYYAYDWKVIVIPKNEQSRQKLVKYKVPTTISVVNDSGTFIAGTFNLSMDLTGLSAEAKTDLSNTTQIYVYTVPTLRNDQSYTVEASFVYTGSNENNFVYSSVTTIQTTGEHIGRVGDYVRKTYNGSNMYMFATIYPANDATRQLFSDNNIPSTITCTSGDPYWMFDINLSGVADPTVFSTAAVILSVVGFPYSANVCNAILSYVGGGGGGSDDVVFDFYYGRDALDLDYIETYLNNRQIGESLSVTIPQSFYDYMRSKTPYPDKLPIINIHFKSYISGEETNDTVSIPIDFNKFVRTEEANAYNPGLVNKYFEGTAEYSGVKRVGNYPYRSGNYLTFYVKYQYEQGGGIATNDIYINVEYGNADRTLTLECNNGSTLNITGLLSDLQSMYDTIILRNFRVSDAVPTYPYSNVISTVVLTKKWLTVNGSAQVVTNDSFTCVIDGLASSAATEWYGSSTNITKYVLYLAQTTSGQQNRFYVSYSLSSYTFADNISQYEVQTAVGITQDKVICNDITEVMQFADAIFTLWYMGALKVQFYRPNPLDSSLMDMFECLMSFVGLGMEQGTYQGIVIRYYDPITSDWANVDLTNFGGQLAFCITAKGLD